MRVVQRLVLTCCLLALASASFADEVIIGGPLIDGSLPTEQGRSDNPPVTTYDYSGSSLEPGSLLDNFATGIQNAARAAGLKLAFLNNVDAGRKEFFELYPDKPGVDEARMKLANLLAEIDLYYLSLYVPAGMSDAEIRRVAAIDFATGGPFGHGIQPSAAGAFSRWVDTAREAMGAIPRDPTAGKINVMTGQPIPDAPQSARVVECTRAVVNCSRTSFVPTPQGYLAGIEASRAFYAYYVVLRDRAELSSARHIALSELPPLTASPPAPGAPASSPLVSHEVVAFEERALGQNNLYAAHSWGDTLPNGADKWSTYKQVVGRILQSGKYRTLDCAYGTGKTYHFWSGSVPPYFSQLTYAVTVGHVVGDGARLGTKSVAECPPDEDGAQKLQAMLLATLEIPNPNATQAEQEILLLSHNNVGAIAPTGGSFSKGENIVVKSNVERFRAEVDKAIAANQKIIDCSFQTLGFVQHYYYWYKSPPENVGDLIHLTYGYNGSISHMGTSARDACPPTLHDAQYAVGQKLTDESHKFINWKDH